MSDMQWYFMKAMIMATIAAIFILNPKTLNHKIMESEGPSLEVSGASDGVSFAGSRSRHGGTFARFREGCYRGRLSLIISVTICIIVYMLIYIHIHIYIYIYIYMYIFTHISYLYTLSIYLSIYLSLSIYIYIHMHTLYTRLRGCERMPCRNERVEFTVQGEGSLPSCRVWC